jgi:hypothetical protein
MMPKTFRRLAVAMVIAGILLAAVGAAIAPFNGGQTAAASASIQGAAWGGAFGNSGNGHMDSRKGHAGRGHEGGCHDDHGMYGHHGVILRVKSVNGTTISATTWGGRPVTVTVSGTTKYREDDMSATLSDVHPGSMILVRGARVGADTIEATNVIIVLPHIGGVVTAVNGSTLTVTGFDGVSHTISVNGNTHFERAGHPATLADVKVGTAIVAEGTENPDGSLSAVEVMIQVPRVIGRVTSINGTSMTVTSPDGTVYTVTTSGSTVYAAPGGTSVSPSSVQVGSFIVAQGTLGADRHTLSALRIIVLPMSCMHSNGE